MNDMTVERFLHTIDGISTWVGKAAAWLIIALMAVVCLEVFKRYLLNAPTAWIFDLNNMLYGSLFMLCGAYALAQNAHVRGDFLYSSMRPRTQALLDLVLYFVFFFPGIAALLYAGWEYAGNSWRIGEHSNVTADGPPVYHFKTVIPVAGALVLLQGFAEVVRCIVCLRTGAWPSRLKDVSEIDVVEEQLALSEHVDDETSAGGDRPRGAHRGSGAAARHGCGRQQDMSDPALGLLMLCLIVVVIMMGFATAFTLMGLGIFFGFIAFYVPGQPWADNKVFALMVQRTYGAMTNDVLISIPLFVLMGYVMERGALVDKMFYSIQLAFRRVPAALAVATLVVCTFWGIASGLVGAVVVLMGVIAFNPMLRAGYDVKLAAGVITAGGTLGILIPPSVMIIVYAAVAGQSVVKLYAAAMFPGFFLAFLYLVYVIGWAMLNPRIAPQLPEEQTRVPVPGWVERLQAAYSRNVLVGLAKALFAPARASGLEADGKPLGYRGILCNFGVALVPFVLAVVVLGRHLVVRGDPQEIHRGSRGRRPAAVGRRGRASRRRPTKATSTAFYIWFAAIAVLMAAGRRALLLAHGRRALHGAEALERLGDAARHPHGDRAGGDPVRHHHGHRIGGGRRGRRLPARLPGAHARLEAHQGGGVPDRQDHRHGVLAVRRLGLFSAVFAILGGQGLVERWALSLNLTPLQFMILSQAIIFILGWPLEWTEIIIIFVPIFLPLLKHYNIDPILWGCLVFVNLQAAFLSPPVAMSAYYLKGVSPPHVTLNQIFGGMMPYMLIVIVCMVIMYLWPGMTLWLPNYLYGG